MKKKLLIYAHYYVPDVASTAQLLQDLAEGMKDMYDVTVVCTVPSYSGKISAKYKIQNYYQEELNGVQVLRVSVPEFIKSNKMSRFRNLTAYYLRARNISKNAGKQDYVLAVSQPPIIGGMLGIYGKKKLGAKLIYCIQDFNPEQVMATGYIHMQPLVKAAMRMDKQTCRKADLVITVGRDLCETLEKRFQNEDVPNYTMINNWIDEKTIYPLPKNNPEVLSFRKQYELDGKFVIMYSGNIGLYYDLEGLIGITERFRDVKTPDGRSVTFAFVGDGSELKKLTEYKKEHKLDHVVFIPYQSKEKLIYSLNAADVHWCVNAKGIKGVSCPSKFYGIAAAGKPVIGVLEQGSEVRMLIDEIGCGKCAEPGEYDKIAENVRWFIEYAGSDKLLEMGQRGRKYLEQHLTKELSVAKYLEAIEKL